MSSVYYMVYTIFDGLIVFVVSTQTVFKCKAILIEMHKIIGIIKWEYISDIPLFYIIAIIKIEFLV